MEYLWQQYDKNNKYVIAQNLLSPYSEVQGMVDGYIEVNPLFRFEKIFRSLFSNNDSILDINLKKEIENILIHYLTDLDFYYGMHKFVLEEEQIEKEIEKVFYGEKIKNIYTNLSKKEQMIILSLLNYKNKIDNKKSLFCEAVRKIFPKAIFYFYKEKRKFLLYIAENDTEENIDKMLLIEDLFLDNICSLEVFWNKHFGIIGENNTMNIDKMIIY
ncbi:hypothetical protein E0L01_02575 [Megamonas funiformis]|uniref:hypothetical protein n=1 Tax=Megamonas funiformis TaxID=437897 RepID=UPI001430E6BD|nr:hypothetical protein [Megamonas funiformis]NJE27652.1 hypothetical protein [Megamonas funiformis]